MTTPLAPSAYLLESVFNIALTFCSVRPYSVYNPSPLLATSPTLETEFSLLSPLVKRPPPSTYGVEYAIPFSSTVSDVLFAVPSAPKSTAIKPKSLTNSTVLSYAFVYLK